MSKSPRPTLHPDVISPPSGSWPTVSSEANPEGGYVKDHDVGNEEGSSGMPNTAAPVLSPHGTVG